MEEKTQKEESKKEVTYSSLLLLKELQKIENKINDLQNLAVLICAEILIVTLTILLFEGSSFIARAAFVIGVLIIFSITIVRHKRK